MPSELARGVGLEKRFGDVVAVRSATCSFAAGEIHTVCGENGAGKSTLLKMIAGMLVPTAGHVEVGGSLLTPHTPREGIRRGVAMVLQHFALVPSFSALENIVLGAEPVSRIGVIDFGAARARAARVAEQLGFVLPLDTPVEDLGIGDRQRLEIARALFRDARLLILDEPTAVLTKIETKALYATLRTLAGEGKGVVVVTHKMDEVRCYADVVTVLRRGELVFTRRIDRSADVRAQVDEVTRAVMGAANVAAKAETRDATDGTSPKAPAIHGTSPADQELPGSSSRDASGAATATSTVVLDVRGVHFGRALTGLDLTVHASEIVGVAGVEGNGQRELVAILAGEVRPDAGTIDGGAVSVIREDRQTEGLVLDAALRDNLVLGELGRFSNAIGVVDLDAMNAEAAARFARSGANGDLDRDARTLSGGNQQKIVIARALARLAPAGAAKVLVAAQPTRGVDIAASRDIHERLAAAAAAGVGVLVLSADLDELRALCSRILVLARGRIVADMPPTSSDEELGRRMLGTLDGVDDSGAHPSAGAVVANGAGETDAR